MNKIQWLTILVLAGLAAIPSAAYAQTRPYIGYVYPAGGQQGTTFQVRLGGQGLNGVHGVLVTGKGVSARLVEYFPKLGPQEMTLLREQLRELQKGSRKGKSARRAADETMMTMEAKADRKPAAAGQDKTTQEMIDKIERRMGAYVNRPACVSISSLAFVEVTVAPGAEIGPREIRLVTLQGVSNPLVFHVGQVPEVCRTPMKTADFQVLGKEELALRKRPEEEVEQRITLPCTVNGQIASGEVNRYRFEASKGQKLVISTQARQLIPYLADAVPGWFQPVLAVFDSQGKELAYNDDYRFKPDPTLCFEVPEDGEYLFTITDAIYRGREDFVYRVSIGELPAVTSIFPLGGPAGVPATFEMKGWNLESAEPLLPGPDAGPGVRFIAARKNAVVSNRVPFALDTLPECFEKESNDDPSHAQKIKLPMIINGRVDRPDDWDVFEVQGRAGDRLVAEVSARRLDSPLDSMLRITDPAGNLLAFNDDHEDLGSGVNTHHADSYLMVELPADGKYCVHLGDTARAGGEEYGYRLRISRPQPDFALRIVPSSISMRSKAAATVSVYAIRKDGFTGDIKLSLKDPPEGFSASPLTFSMKREVARFTVKNSLVATKEPVSLTIEGRAKVGDGEIAREAVAAEDRMQAFLWRHLVPAEELKALVFDPSYTAPPRRVRPSSLPKPEAGPADPAAKAKFTKQQVAGRLRQLKLLYEEGLLTDEFNDRKVAECEAAL